MARRYAAFLRGMNLGGRRITNAALCACFEQIGLASVSAFLASGNVLFSASRVPRGGWDAWLAAQLEQRLGYAVPTFVRDADQVRAIAAHVPFEVDVGRGGGRLQVALLGAVPGPAARRAVLRLATDDDRLALTERELYWLARGNMSASELDLRAIERAVGPMTIRTRRTLERIAATKL